MKKYKVLYIQFLDSISPSIGSCNGATLNGGALFDDVQEAKKFTAGCKYGHQHLIVEIDKDNPQFKSSAVELV